jgi:hypothetical protein
MALTTMAWRPVRTGSWVVATSTQRARADFIVRPPKARAVECGGARSCSLRSVSCASRPLRSSMRANAAGRSRGQPSRNPPQNQPPAAAT